MKFTIADFPPRAPRRPQRSKYQELAQAVVDLPEGKSVCLDINGDDPETMRARIYTALRTRGVKGTTRISDGKLYIKKA